MKRFIRFATASLLSGQSCAGFSANGSSSERIRASLTNLSGNNDGAVVERRDLFRDIFAAAAAFSATVAPTPPPASALDFDAFESREISRDAGGSDPEMSDDEALCRYGAPGRSMGEACERAKIRRKIPGGVDASGKVDRGDYLKCKYEYPVVDGNYVKTRVCKPSSEWGSDIS